MKILSTNKITARRHEMFWEFSTRALAAQDAGQACNYGAMALKALSGPEHEPPSTTDRTGEANPLSGFEADLQRAYATD